MEMAIVTAVTDPGVLADFPHFPNTARVKNNIVALWLCRVYQVCLAATAPTFASKTRSNFRRERDQAALRTGPRRQPSSVSSTICHRSIRYHWGGVRREQPGLSLLQQHGGLSSRLAAADLYGMYVITRFCGVVLLPRVLHSPVSFSSQLSVPDTPKRQIYHIKQVLPVTTARKSMAMVCLKSDGAPVTNNTSHSLQRCCAFRLHADRRLRNASLQ